MTTKIRPLVGYLKSRKAIDSFLSGNSKREFEIRVQSEGASQRLRPNEACGRDWYSPDLGAWVTGDKFTVDQLNSVRKSTDGVLVLYTYD